MEDKKLFEILQMFDHRQTSQMKEILEMGIVLEYLMNLLTEKMSPEEKAAAEKEFQDYRDFRFTELKQSWESMKAKAVEMQD